MTCIGSFSVARRETRLETIMVRNRKSLIWILGLLMTMGTTGTVRAEFFEGQYYRGEGDRDYLELLDIARRMCAPDPEYQNIAMLYTPDWNGFVEGPTWGAWWIQNSYGPSYCLMPVLQEPYVSFLQNAQDLWFDQMGDGTQDFTRDGKTEKIPDGCLCDAANPSWFMPKQGDGRVDIHDWGMEFTAAGLLLQAEMVLIGRDAKAIEHYLPKLERCAEFIETRRDPEKNLFLAGPAGNLLAPSYAGYKKADGTYDKAYLTGLSVTYIAALNRLIELEKLAGHNEKVELYSERRKSALDGLKRVTAEEGYFIKSLDPDGVKHGVYGAEKYGYFEASPNHDAIAFRVVGDEQAEKIYQKIVSIPGLRPHDFIIPNYPGLDDMYVGDTDWLWSFGTWVNGGHWSTCEARMVMAYYRLGQYEDARRSMAQLLTFAHQFRMDNPLVEFGSKVYQPNEPINLCYDSFGPPAALIRGLYEYLYDAEGVTLVPHIPTGITFLEQQFPIRIGTKQLFLTSIGSGPIVKVEINGKAWNHFDDRTITLPYHDLPREAMIEICLGEAKESVPAASRKVKSDEIPPMKDVPQAMADAIKQAEPFIELGKRLHENQLGDSYEAAHCQTIQAAVGAMLERLALQQAGELKTLPEASQAAADNSYVDTVIRLCTGLQKVIETYPESTDTRQKKIYTLWQGCLQK